MPNQSRRILLFALMLVSPLLGGCSILGLAASRMPVNVKAAYPGLAGQSVAVMVAADRGTQLEHRRVQLDIAERIDASLKAMTMANNVDEVKGTTYPEGASPAAIYGFQRNYPQYEWEPVTTVAPFFKVTRVIHVEIEAFTLHADNVPELWRGEVTARVQVAEVTGDTAKIAFDDRITAGFPEKSGGVGSTSLGPQNTYRGTVNSFVTAVTKRFVTHPED